MDALRAVTPLAEARAGDFAQCLLDGLSRTHKDIPCKYFYDDEGSRLFDAICELPEYYQTRTETVLLARHADEIARLMGREAEIVEFGAGSLKKVRLLLEAARPRGYTPIDISGDYLMAVTEELAADYPNLALRPLVADFTAALSLPPLAGVRARAGFFPGSTIGNFRPDAAAGLLRRMHAALFGGGLLIGVDLVKDPARLHAAYNDAAGVTARFNKNLLARANREMGADFDLDGFDHYAPYNPAARRIEMYLVSRKHQSATIRGRRLDFAAGEAVHTEDSHKYTVEGFAALAGRAGWRLAREWRDSDDFFMLAWLEPL